MVLCGARHAPDAVLVPPLADAPAGAGPAAARPRRTSSRPSSASTRSHASGASCPKRALSWRNWSPRPAPPTTRCYCPAGTSWQWDCTCCWTASKRCATSGWPRSSWRASRSEPERIVASVGLAALRTRGLTRGACEQLREGAGLLLLVHVGEVEPAPRPRSATSKRTWATQDGTSSSAGA